MARTKGGVTGRRRHKRWLKLAKGFRGRRSKVFSVAKLAVIRALTYAYISRRTRKRDMRRLWNARISAASKANGLSYSKFIGGLKKSNIELDRKILASVAAEDSKTFTTLIEVSRASLD